MIRFLKRLGHATPVRKMKNARRDLFMLTYAQLAGLVAIVIFLSGFFPIKYNNDATATMADIPDHVGHVRVKPDELYRPIVKRVVLVIIDALRWDFITGPVGVAAMPITNRLIESNSGCLLQAKVDPPTVTMPRIKAMMTGAVPNFAGVALNFGDLPESGDNLLLQAKNQGHTLNFYGDDTWLKIFPNIFHRHDGTTSFFVPDFTEVDDNVTRHVAEELRKKDDWSVLILHYLGLDHIGHFAGPFSPLIKPKLMEMDKVIGQIEREIRSWNENESPTMLVVCGDHGMKDSGGHGGSTPEETLVPFLTFGASSCPAKNNHPNRMAQVDVASTLSVMLGLPIPALNVGSVPLVMLNGLPDSSKLFILYYNSQQVFKQFEELPGYESSQTYDYYKEAVRLHVDWLTDQKKNNNARAALFLYDKSLQGMKDLLIHSLINYNLDTMTAAMIFMTHIIHILMNGQNYRSATISETIYWIFGSFLLYLILKFLWEPDLGLSALFNVNSITIMIIGLGVALNSCLCANLHWSWDIRDRLSNYTWTEYIFFGGMIAHTISLASTSFVEEEHQTWYFFWATLLVLLFLDITGMRSNLLIAIEILFTLLGHRLLRTLNSTGDKYANLPDIADWLGDQDNNIAMTALLLGALGVSMWIGYLCEEKKFRRESSIAHAAAAICIYLRHAATGTVAQLPFYFDSRGIVEVRMFWIVMVLYSLYWIYRLFWTMNRKLFERSLLRFLIQFWVMTSAILHRPHNVMLLPMQVLSSYIVESVLSTYGGGDDANIFAHICLGNVFYFYQGNSNSLATVDITAGYVGMESYRPLVTGLFLIVNTYSAPVLAYLLLVYRSTLRQERKCYSETISSVNRTYTLWRLIPITVYTLIVTMQRFHLFVWTVFSPKLLYEATHCAVIFLFMLMLQLAGVLCT